MPHPVQGPCGGHRSLASLLACLASAALCPVAPADVVVDPALLAANYTESFDGLPTEDFTWSNNGSVPGWYAAPGNGSLDTSARENDGGSNARDLVIHSLGQSGDSERALTYHTRAAATPTYLGLAFSNQSGGDIAGFTVGYTAEQWKEGTDNRTLTYTVEYRIGATADELDDAAGWTEMASLTIDTQGGATGRQTALSSGLVLDTIPAGSSFWLRWKLANDADSATSSNDTLGIDDVTVDFEAPADLAPSIDAQPLPQTVAVGDTASFSVEVSGTPEPGLQWFLDGSPVSGATSSTLLLEDVQLSQAGNYTVTATNSEGSATSDPALLTVSATPLPPQITVEPADASGDLGGSVTLEVIATGSGTLEYSWTKDGSPVAGADAAGLTFDPLQESDAGTYRVTVSNSAGSLQSGPALVTVFLPPLVDTAPVGQTAAEGSDVTLSVAASGKAPLSYTWFKDGEEIAGETGPTLELNGVGAIDAGDYHVTVGNALGSESTAPVELVVTAPPALIAQPQPQAVLVGGTATFSVEAAGSGPIGYQWFKESAALAGETGPSLTLVGVGEADVAAYSVEVTNPYGTTPSIPAGLTVTEGLPASAFNLAGFGEATTGGGVIPETDPGYVQVSTPLEFVTALDDDSGAIRVIEILNDLDLGYNEVDPAVREFGIFREHSTPRLHPVLIASGVSRIDVKELSKLTIFSANGASIRHASLNIKRCNNMIIRNLKFDELWEWDEDSKGDYDGNDWDFITLGDSGTVWDIWIDHCTFTKSYDGICDIKGGSHDITFSWCHYAGDDGATNPSSFVRRQIAALEANRGSHGMYDFLRSNGFSVEDIVRVMQGPSKMHLIGANTLNSENADHKVTFHHQWYENPWDRLPRLRAGNVHNYNIYVDCETARQAKAMRDARVAAMDPSDASKLSSSGQYNFNPFLNGSISTEDGAVLVEKSYYKDCLTPLRNNQTDPSDPVFTGKILGLDCITRMTDDAGVSTTVRGDSTDPGNPMGPVQAPVKPFSWNLPGGVLPYSYTMDDPADLPDILAAGAGAGKLTWDKENWLKTSYAAQPPGIVGGLSPVSAAFGEEVSFSVGVTGDPPFSYVWKRDGVTIEDEAGASLVIAAATPADAGTISVTVSNASGSDQSSALLSVADPNDEELLRYALGSDPASGQTLLPTVSVSGGVASIRFQRLRVDVDYLVEATDDFTGWDPVVTNPGLPGDWVEVADLADPGEPRRFLRLRLVYPQP